MVSIAVNVTHQSSFVANVLQLLVFNLAVLGMAFLARLGYKITVAHWPHATIPWTLFVIGITGIVFGLDVQIGTDLLANLATLHSHVADWVNRVAIAGLQIGILIFSTSACWFGLLLRLYPLDPSSSVGLGRITRRDLVVVSLLIAWTSGYAAFVLMSWVSRILVALEMSFAVSLLAVIMAFAILNCAFRTRRPSS